ncbi:MAG: DUF2085 domain-containing protein [Chloroflexota bacterium]
MPIKVASPSGRRWLRRTAALLAAAVILAFLLAPPTSVLDKADNVGFAVCHRIDHRSFHVQGRQLPLCVRCTGTYLGVLAGLGAFWLRGRRRAVGFPPLRVLIVLLGFWMVFGLDGLNSYLALIGMPHLYEPHHILRVFTGCLNGVALSTLVWPVFNFSLWKQTDPQPVIRNLWEMAGIVALAWGLSLVVYTEVDFLLYPVALVSSLGVLLMLTLVNSMLVLALIQPNPIADTWRDAALPLALGLALALIEIGVLDFVRFNLLPPLSF